MSSYYITQKFDGGKLDEWLAICQKFFLSIFFSPLKPTINLSDFTHQNLLNVSF